MINRPRVTIVCGPPCSGKSTYVAEHRQHGDVVIAYDLLRSSITGLPEHERPNACEGEVHWIVTAGLNAMMDRVATSRLPLRVWIIACLSTRRQRVQLAQRMRAELVLMDTSQEECLRRMETRGDNERWTRAIAEWFESNAR